MDPSKEIIKQELADKILLVLQKVTEENFSQFYREIEQVVVPYKNLGLTKEDVLEVLNDAYKEKRYLKIDLSESQDEVLGEIASCLIGYCPPHLRIEW